MRQYLRLACRGFTLTELLVALAAGATLLSLAVPSLARFINTARVSAASGDMMAALILTRSEAMKRRARVVLCKSADGQTCAAAGGWQQGWIVFVDGNGDGERAASEPLLHARQALGGSLRFSASSPVARYVSYGPTGATLLVSGGFQAGTLTVCGQSTGGTSARQIILSASGRPRTQTVQLPSCL